MLSAQELAAVCRGSRLSVGLAKLIRENPAKLAGPNPQPRRTEIVPFSIEEVDRLALELTSVRVIDATYGHLAHGSEQLARQRLDVWALSGRGGEMGTQ
jgi:hypothetical protein